MEDTAITKAEIAETFGKPVADLVDGLSKLDKIEFQSAEHAQARTSARCCWRWRATCASS
jgi:guanosine-3',5'-bis(diphosphate) 3'-pyrophosphohydrolase